jgi:hypothetical protein
MRACIPSVLEPAGARGLVGDGWHWHWLQLYKVTHEETSVGTLGDAIVTRIPARDC